MRQKIKHILTLLLLLTTLTASAQSIKQTPAFKSGETLECNFYFNWKFIWVKAGGASLIIRDTIFNGQRAQYMSLLSTTNSTADAFFRMRDTLTTIFTPDLKPLYYRKASAEGKRYYLNQVWYKYCDDGRIKVSQYYRRDNETPIYKEEYVNKPVYDMMSLLAYARTLDFASLKKGQRLTFPVATGKRITNQHLIYRGKKRTKSDDGNDRYDCLVISLVEERDGKEREIINFHVTDDNNHLPILLDLALNFGSAKARLTDSNGLLYPLEKK